MDSNLKEKIKLIAKNKEQTIQFINLTFKLFFASVFVSIMRSKMTALTTLFLIMNYSIYSYFL